MKTEKGFVIGFSKNDREDFCWFVRHVLIDGGKPLPINRGDLEAYLNKCKKKITKILKKKQRGQ